MNDLELGTAMWNMYNHGEFKRLANGKARVNSLLSSTYRTRGYQEWLCHSANWNHSRIRASPTTICRRQITHSHGRPDLSTKCASEWLNNCNCIDIRSVRANTHITTTKYFYLYLKNLAQPCPTSAVLSYLSIDCVKIHMGHCMFICHRKYSTKRQLSVVSVLYLPPWNKYGQFL